MSRKQTTRFGVLAALLMTLAACQSTGGTLPSADDCTQINENNRERCQTGI
ncbi:MAG: hypothetical protein AAF321_06570 [Pseudomonadota bacterium]